MRIGASGADISAITSSPPPPPPPPTTQPQGGGTQPNPFNIADPRHYVQNLQHDGDTATYSVNGQGKVMVGLPAPGLKGGAQGQLGGSVVVTQHGKGNAATYTVTVSGRGLVGAIGEVTPSTGVNNFDDNTNAGLEVNVSNTPFVTMTYNSKADAVQAVGDIENLPLVAATHPLAQGADNVVHAAFNMAKLPNPFGITSRFEQGITAPLDGAAQAYDSETGFLKSHVTSYGDTTDIQIRLKGQAKLSDPLNVAANQALKQFMGGSAPGAAPGAAKTLAPWLKSLSIDGRLDTDLTFTRTITPGQSHAPGTVSYTFGALETLDPKVKADINLGGVQVSPQTIRNLAQGQSSLTLTYALDKKQSDYLAANPLPGPGDLVQAVSGQPLKSTIQLSSYAEAPKDWLDPIGTSTDRTRGTLTATTTNGSGADAFKAYVAATGGSVASVGAFLTGGSAGYNRQMSQVRNGVVGWARAGNGTAQLTTQHLHDVGLNAQLDVISPDVPIPYTLLKGDLSVAPIVNIGNTYVTGSKPSVLTQPAPTHPTQPPVHPTQPPTHPTQQLVVLPHDGLNVRSAPGTNASIKGALSEGSFVQTDGTTMKDPSGTTWVRVSGYDGQRKPVSGWADASYLKAHSQGGEDAGGRIDQTLRSNGYVPVSVQSGDTLDGIAARYGVPPSQIVAVNQQHVIDPNLIFPGDTVYVPGRDSHRTSVAAN